MNPLNRSKNSVFRPLRGVAARCLLAAVPLAIAPAADAGYNLTFVTDPTGTNFINLLGINDSGTIAGFDNSATNQGFTLTLPSSFTTVNFPGAASSMVTGINATGDLSGIYVDAAGVNHGFTDIGGTFKTVDNPASPVFNQALGINNSDETVGYYAPTITGSPGDVSYSQKGGVFTAIGGLPTNFNNQAVGINSAATPWIVGFYQPELGPRHFVRLPRRRRHDHHHRSVRIDVHAGARRQRPRRDCRLLHQWHGSARLHRQRRRLHQLRPVRLSLDDDQRRQRQGRLRRLLHHRERHRRWLRRDAGSGAFDLGDDAPWLRGVWSPLLSQGTHGDAGGLSLFQSAEVVGVAQERPSFFAAFVDRRAGAYRRRFCAREFERCEHPGRL